jgi:hypothetical protein
MPLEPGHIERMAEYDWQSNLPPMCPKCGYNLRGATTNRCPECGYLFLSKEIKREAANLQAMMQRAEEVNDLVGIGFKVALVGAVLLVVGTVLGTRGGSAPIIGRLLGFIAGFIGLCLGLAYVRVLRLPNWARDELKNPPNNGLAIGTIVLSAALMVLAFINW